MQRVVVGSTTHVDRHNMRMTKVALESMAHQINSGRKPVATIEHDTTLPPIGKYLHAWIEPMEDGEYRLLIVQEIFEKDEPVTLPDGLQGLKRESTTDNSPFVKKVENFPETITLDTDLANFASLSEYEAFLNEIKVTSSLSFQDREIGRKSVIPDPEVIITLSRDILAYLVAKKVIDKFSDKISDKLSDKVSEDIADFYIWVKSVAIKYAKYVIPKNRPITYVFSVPMTPHVELVARTTDASEIAAAIMLDNLEEPLKLAQEYRDKLGAERVQFLLNEAGEWRFNYMLTDKGQVIGTKKSFSRKARQFDLASPINMISSNNTPKQLKQPPGTTLKKTKRRKR